MDSQACDLLSIFPTSLLPEVYAEERRRHWKVHCRGGHSLLGAGSGWWSVHQNAPSTAPWVLCLHVHAWLRDRFGSSFPAVGKEAVLLSQVTPAPADGMKPMVCSRHAYPRWLAAGDLHMQEKQADFQTIQGWR
ncbi:uncharacterized protein ACIBXB_010950 isoform 2-T28 [Morphnus guianensis]